MADVVEQGGGQEDAHVLVVEDQGWIGPQQPDQELLGQVVDAEGMLEAGVAGAGVDEVDEAELADGAQPLEVLGVDEGQQRARHVDVAPDRIPDGLAILLEKGVEGHLGGNLPRPKNPVKQPPRPR